jgi:hypothetical protein
MTKYSIAAACTLTLALASSSFAGTAAPAKESKIIKEVCKESCITGDIGFGVVSEYISRGVVNENQGFIAQPYLDLYFKLYEGEGFINKVSLNLGLWSSIHSEKTFASPGTALPAWYEFDWMPGMTVTFAKNFALTVTWLDFDFVSSGGRAGNVLGNLSYDDTDLLGAFALHPHIAVMKTFIGNGVGVPGGAYGWYYEAGIAPGFTVGKGGTYPVSFTIPLTVGGGHETYNDDFGYFSAGINASVPLAFVPTCYGNWTLGAGFTYVYQGDDAAEASAPALTSGDDNNQFIFSGSLGLTF